jgi:tetraacyldisaccharide 4'-kinase
MKTPAFWYRHKGFRSTAMLPLAGLYQLGGMARRIITTPYASRIPVICIGNIVAGGAGKTPVALAVAKILKDKGAKPVFVTRGYGGKEAGPLLVDVARHTAKDVGDEALLLAREAPVWVGRDRAAAIIAAESDASHIIMDDGLQNPGVKPSLSFLVIDGETGLGNGRILPAGPLRETLGSAMGRINAIIIVGGHDAQNIASRSKHPVIRATWQPRLPEGFPKAANFLAFAGIGRPEKFYRTCSNAGLHLVAKRDFADHHAFTEAEMQDLLKNAKAKNAQLLTTEKDWVRLPEAWRNQVVPFPVTLVFDQPEKLKALVA